MMAGGLAGMLAMMGGGSLPAFPCALCTLEVAQLEAEGETAPAANMTTTVVLGTPVCVDHAAALLSVVTDYNDGIYPELQRRRLERERLEDRDHRATMLELERQRVERNAANGTPGAR